MKILRCAAASIAFVMAAGIAGSLVGSQAMVYRNISPSMPLGFYLRNPVGEPAKDAVIVFPPPAIALAHGWPADIPLIKHVGAVGGDKVCSDGIVLKINDDMVALVTKRLPNGRPAPVWTGCQVLRGDQVFPIATGLPDSLDGRAYGPIPVASISGVFVPAWTWEAF